MQVELLGMALVFAAAAGIAGLLIWLTSALGPKKPNPTKDMPFECGEAPFSILQGRFAVKFYVAAMLFVIFDAELVFLFPWATVLEKLGWFGYFEMLAFLLMVVAGYAYAWRKGALQWA